MNPKTTGFVNPIHRSPKTSIFRACDMNCAGFLFHSEDILCGLGILILRLGDAADFPAGGEFDGDVVGFEVRILEINGVHAVGVFEHALFGGAKSNVSVARMLSLVVPKRSPTRALAMSWT